MADLSSIIKGSSFEVEAIDRYYEANQSQRRRLGLSQAGHKCPRFLWYKHKGYDEPKIDGRVLRLFQLGNLLEEQTINDLKDCGFTLHSQQSPVEITNDGITLTGSIDGIIEGLIEAPCTRHLFEHKTASKKKYDELLKKGYREWNEVYYWQTQFYMLGLKLKRAAAFVYCKDDSRLYMERIELDQDKTIDRLQDIFIAISKETQPERLCETSEQFDAKWCPFYNVCF